MTELPENTPLFMREFIDKLPPEIRQNVMDGIERERVVRRARELTGDTFTLPLEHLLAAVRSTVLSARISAMQSGDAGDLNKVREAVSQLPKRLEQRLKELEDEGLFGPHPRGTNHT